MSVYIACPVPHIDSARRLKRMLEAHGIPVRARWIDDPNLGYGRGKTSMAERATADVEDVQAAHALFAFALDGSKGGTHTELGMALQRRIRIYLIGTPFQVFHFHPHLRVCATMEEAISAYQEV